MTTPPMPPRLVDDTVRLAALGVLETAREMDAWDQMPMLILVAEGTEKPVCIPVPVPDAAWLNAHPVNVLKGMTYGVTKGHIRLALEPPANPGDIRGVLLITEGHVIEAEELTPAEQATLDDFKAHHRLEEHPKSREVRMASMMDRSLTPALARHFRGKEVSDRIVYGFDGRIPEAMSRFVTALLSSWMAEADKPN